MRIQLLTNIKYHTIVNTTIFTTRKINTELVKRFTTQSYRLASSHIKPILPHISSIPIFLTDGGYDGQTVNNGVQKAPTSLPAVRVNPRLVGRVQLFLELHQLPPSHALPVILPQIVTVVPQSVQEITFHPFHAAFVEGLECPLGEPEDERAQTAIDHHQHQL